MRKAMVVLATLGVLLPACGGDDGGATAATGETSGTGATGATATGPTAATGPSEDCADLTSEEPGFTITIANFAFDPACFTANASQEISVVNEDDVGHTFTVVETDLNVPIAGGETFNGESIGGVVAPGTYEFVCTIHPQMTGEVTVVA